MFFINQLRLKLFVLALVYFLAVSTQETNHDLEETKVQESSPSPSPSFSPKSVYGQILIRFTKAFLKKILESNTFSLEDERMLLLLARKIIRFKSFSPNETRMLVNLLQLIFERRQQQEKTSRMNSLVLKKPKYMHWRQGR